VIVLTNSTTPAEVRHCSELGGDAYWEKPRRLEEFSWRVQEVVSFWCKHPAHLHGQ
jgi:DNA-binding response OmpR family regulator